MRIGELAEATGVSVRSLRYYEEQGLLRPMRTLGGWRDFEDSSIERVVLIQHLYAAGLSSSTVYEILPCLESPEQERTGEMDRLLAEATERLVTRRRELDRELDTLQALRDDLAARRM